MHSGAFEPGGDDELATGFDNGGGGAQVRRLKFPIAQPMPVGTDTADAPTLPPCSADGDVGLVEGRQCVPHDVALPICWRSRFVHYLRRRVQRLPTSGGLYRLGIDRPRGGGSYERFDLIDDLRVEARWEPLFSAVFAAALSSPASSSFAHCSQACRNASICSRNSRPASICLLANSVCSALRNREWVLPWLARVRL